PWNRTVIYEAHVRGLSMLHPAVPPEERGTFSALKTDELIDHISSLGVTAVELLPVHAFVDDQYLLEKGLRNYWGYNTLGFFAPQARYMSTRTVAEFKQMVARLHHAGLEVLLDVVYNHTAEGNELGPTLSFKGIDNASYYRLADDRRFYINDTGTGNTFDLTNVGALRMVMDSLRYWVQEMHVDGFRFDLASILGRERYGFDPSGSFLDAVRQDPVLSQTKLIAEPWDIGPGGYQVGNFPPGWVEWNDKFRDNVRAFWRGDSGQLAELATRLTGSADLFNHSGRRPTASVNFVTAHDGFTLRDLVSYETKHNLANGEDGRDGSDHYISSSCGVEGG
ncbi:glycogen debranching enzyme GlgX, partial [Xanthomonas perforans]|nr:glycogen debranching enzyme GlgX [Xanthomonas perforans]